jgi:hypothetical protein
MKPEHLHTLRKLTKELRLRGVDEVCNKVVLAIFSETNAQDAKPDLSYSFILRKLRKSPERAKEFQIAFKKAFDQAFLEGLHNPDDAAMLQAIQEIDMESEEVQ